MSGQGGEREATGAGGTAARLVPQTRAGVLTCAVVGGTHGNELTGVALVGKWTRQAHAAPLSLSVVPEVHGPPPPSTGSHADAAPGTGSASGGPRCATGDDTARATGASTSLSTDARGPSTRTVRHLARDSMTVFPLLANTAAVHAERRYVNADLNRSFTSTVLTRPCGGGECGVAEEVRAKEIAAVLASHHTDLCLDLHNTTSASSCLIVSRPADLFGLHCAAAMLGAARAAGYADLKIWSPAVWVQPGGWSESTTPTAAGAGAAEASPFAHVGSVVPSDIGIELGPQPHGVLLAWTVALAEVLVHAALDFCEAFNAGAQLPQVDGVELFSLAHAVKYPAFDFDADPATTAPPQRLRTLVHPRLQGRDFRALHPSDPAFVSLETGGAIAYGGAESCYPVFVNEGAYLENGTAFYACTRHAISLPPLRRASVVAPTN